MKRVLVLFLFIIAFSSQIAAQNEKLNLTFEKILFEEFVDTIETMLPVKIYYANEWVDSLYISVKSNNQSLTTILDKIFQNKKFSYIETDRNKIIISKEYKIKTDYAIEYKRYLQTKTYDNDTNIYTLPTVTSETEDINEELKVFRIGSASKYEKGKLSTLTGYITHEESGESIPGTTVYIDELKKGTISDYDGYYELSVPTGRYNIQYRNVGMNSTNRNVMLYSDGSLDVAMSEPGIQLNEITIKVDRQDKVQNMNIGVEQISSKMMRQIPMAMGEADAIKSSLLLPGVQTVSEASAGFNVRGGSSDQNLILLNGAPIINSSHFFGFFSAFNSDMIENVTLYKNGIPAKYGGRVSSVMEIDLIQASKEKFKMRGGVNPFSARLLAEIPLGNRASIAASGRATYSDWILGLLNNKQLQKSSAGFYDFQAIADIDINARNTLSFSGYYSNDKFNLHKQSAFDYSNIATTINWRHQYNAGFNSTISFITSQYDYELSSLQDTASFKKMLYSLQQKIVRADFCYLLDANHTLDFGFEGKIYNLMPGKQIPLGENSIIQPKTLQKESAWETALYISDEYNVSSVLNISAGLRLPLFVVVGPRDLVDFGENSPHTKGYVIDTIQYSNNEIINSNLHPEFRFIAKLNLWSDNSIKAGYQRIYQYIHKISNTASVSPTDIWKLSAPNIPPQRGDQISIGYYQNFFRKKIETSFEMYYKKMDNIIDYRSGAELLMKENLETELLAGIGKSYGMEFMIKKPDGDLTGWISYTYSRALHKFDSEFESDKVNNGNFFPANFDKPHDLKLVLNYKISRRLNLTSNFSYSTGRPITYPVGYYDFMNSKRIYYSNRNEYRIDDYIRLDFAVNINGNLKAKKLNHSSLTFAVYNIFGRKNPYSIFFKSEMGEINGYQMSIFGKPIFTITYNFKILGNAADDF